MIKSKTETFEEILRDKEHIPVNGIQNMLDVANKLLLNLEKEENISGLLYGRVQSGKTNSMIMCMAKLIDSGKFKLFIVLTSDNTSLYKQTLSRITNGLSSIGVIGYTDIAKGNENVESIRTKLGHSGAVFVCTKNPSNLKTLNAFLTSLKISHMGAVIFDDEADFGSLNSKQNQKEESAVFSLIETLRKIIAETKFVEVTATPQANLLQKPNDPRHPSFIIQIKPGDGYVGGDKLYDLQIPDVLQKHHMEIPDSEIDLITNDNTSPENAPESIYRALCIFFMGAAMKHLSSPGKNNFSMLVHISAKRSVNSRLFDLVTGAKNKISKTIHGDINNVQINDCLKEAYENILRTIRKNEEITYMQALETIENYIDQSRPQRIISGRANDDPSYDAFYNIMIGGNRLSRGLTVKNLTVFYYARTTGAPKVDTILQHSRVYGYREDILDIIRIFSTKRIFDYLYDVYMSDQEEWEYIQSGNYPTGHPVLLSIRKSGRVRLTRSQVVPMTSLLKYFPGKTYFLYQAKSSNLEEIDKLVENMDSKSMNPTIIDLNLALKLIDLTDTYKPDQRWNKEAVKAVLQNLKDEKGNNIYLLVRKESDLSKDYYAVLSGQIENKIWKDDGPILFMYKTSGKGKGWNGEKVWIPVLRLPQGASAYYLSERESVSDEGEE